MGAHCFPPSGMVVVEVLFSKMLKAMTAETSTLSTPTITVKRTLKDCLFICIINGCNQGWGMSGLGAIEGP